MGYVFAGGTTVGGFPNAQSVSTNSQPQINRLWVLGSETPFDEQVYVQQTVSVTCYAPGPAIDLAPSYGCADSSSFAIGVSPGYCEGAGAGGGAGGSINGFLTSYSYSKDPQNWGMCSYSFVSKPTLVGGGGGEVRMLRGVSEGSTGGCETGVQIEKAAFTGFYAEVTAGNPGLGRAGSAIYGTVSSVGGGVGKAQGVDGQGNASCPYTPLYM